MLILFLCYFARILNLFAEENAVEDTIYYLSESLRKEAIDLELFLKVTLRRMIIIFKSSTCNPTEIRSVSNCKKALPYVSWVGDFLYCLLTEFEGHTVSYGPSFFLLDLWPKREARGP